jgi:hypothetical protein
VRGRQERQEEGENWGTGMKAGGIYRDEGQGVETKERDRGRGSTGGGRVLGDRGRLDKQRDSSYRESSYWFNAN